MIRTKNDLYKKLYIATVLLCFILCFFTVYLRIESIKIGYEIGNLKKKERILLEKTSQLEMSLAKISSKSSLIKLAKLTEY